jgi:hypothetical protein
MFAVTHNGNKIEYKKDMNEVNQYIQSVITGRSNLQPKLVYNYRVGNAIFICYRYYTLYCEMFLIEEEKS